MQAAACGQGPRCTSLWRVGRAVWLGAPICVREIGFGRKRPTSPPPWREASGEPGGEPRGTWCEARKSSRLVRVRVRVVRVIRVWVGVIGVWDGVEGEGSDWAKVQSKSRLLCSLASALALSIARIWRPSS